VFGNTIKESPVYEELGWKLSFGGPITVLICSEPVGSSGTLNGLDYIV
jgi:hypothetical protein